MYNTTEIITSFPSISNTKQRELDFLAKRTQMKLEFQRKINLKKNKIHDVINLIEDISNHDTKINNQQKESASTSLLPPQNHYKVCERNKKIFDDDDNRNIDIFTLVKKIPKEEKIEKTSSTLYSQRSTNDNKSSNKNQQIFEVWYFIFFRGAEGLTAGIFFGKILTPDKL